MASLNFNVPNSYYSIGYMPYLFNSLTLNERYNNLLANGDNIVVSGFKLENSTLTPGKLILDNRLYEIKDTINVSRKYVYVVTFKNKVTRELSKLCHVIQTNDKKEVENNPDVTSYLLLVENGRLNSNLKYLRDFINNNGYVSYGLEIERDGVRKIPFLLGAELYTVVYMDGMLCKEGVDYTIENEKINFTYDLIKGDIIEVVSYYNFLLLKDLHLELFLSYKRNQGNVEVYSNTGFLTDYGKNLLLNKDISQLNFTSVEASTSQVENNNSITNLPPTVYTGTNLTECEPETGKRKLLVSFNNSREYLKTIGVYVDKKLFAVFNNLYLPLRPFVNNYLKINFKQEA